MDAAWAKIHATRPEVKRVDVAVGIRGGLLTGEPSEPGDQVLELPRQEFLNHGIGFTLMDIDYSVESMLRVAANSLGGIHNDGKPNRDKEAEELRKYMEQGGATWFGRSMPAAMIFEIARCTLRACQPIADELTRLGLYEPASSEWIWSAEWSLQRESLAPDMAVSWAIRAIKSWKERGWGCQADRMATTSAPPMGGRASGH